MPPWNPVETELTTAATDALLGLLCLGLAVWLTLSPVPATWKRHVWVAVLSCMAAGSFLGAVAHGFALRDGTRDMLWKPLYFTLGLAVALVVVGAVYDWWGEATARWLLPWALLAAVGFFAASQLLGGAFAIFIAYEAAATLTALAIYGALASRGAPGASAVAAGLVLSLVAAAVQVSRLSLQVLVRLDHNGLFHLVQMIAVIVMSIGVRRGLGD